MIKKHLTYAQAKLNFNDIVMRELNFDVDENDHLVDMNSETILTLKDKFIKYSEEEYPVIGFNEIELNLLENSRLMETIFGLWVKQRAESKGLSIASMYHSAIRGSDRGFFVVTYLQPDGEISEVRSDIYLNESVRIFDLICKLRHTSHLYDMNMFDIPIKMEV